MKSKCSVAQYCCFQASQRLTPRCPSGQHFHLKFPSREDCPPLLQVFGGTFCSLLNVGLKASFFRQCSPTSCCKSLSIGLTRASFCVGKVREDEEYTFFWNHVRMEYHCCCTVLLQLSYWIQPKFECGTAGQVLRHWSPYQSLLQGQCKSQLLHFQFSSLIGSNSARSPHTWRRCTCLFERHVKGRNPRTWAIMYCLLGTLAGHWIGSGGEPREQALW